MGEIVAAILMVFGLAGAGPMAEPLSYRQEAGVFGEAQAALGLLRFGLAGLSGEPSDAELDLAVRRFWQAAGLRVSTTTKLACYRWEGPYFGHGRPVICRYSLVFDDQEKERTTIESGFDNEEADHWYLTTKFGTGQTCVGCPINR